MELEVAELQPPLKSKLSGRVKSYKNELARLQKEFVSFLYHVFNIYSIRFSKSC